MPNFAFIGEIPPVNNMERDTYQRFSKEVIVIGIMSLLVALSDFLWLPLLTKTLGVQDYGIWTQVKATVGLIVPLAGLGLPFAMVRFLAAKKDKKEIREIRYEVISELLNDVYKE